MFPIVKSSWNGIWLMTALAVCCSLGGAEYDWHCSSDLECNLNGRCLNNTYCSCDQGWVGVNCSRMDLMPTAVGSGYRPQDRSSWGGSVFYEDGLYHLIVAEMVQNCGLTSWKTNSKTTLATSKDLFGSYDYQSTVLGVWTHNPVVVRLADGSYLLFSAGYADGKTPAPLPCYPSGCCINGMSPCGVNSIHACNSSSPPWPHPPPSPDWRDPERAYQNFSIWHSEKLKGPWERHWVDFGDQIKSHQYTPAAWAFPNGTVVTLLAGGGLFKADTWRGPYHYWGAGKDLVWGCGGEDPFLYVDARGHWHCLFHAGPYPDLANAGGHAFSEDGTTWHTTPGAVYRGDFVIEYNGVKANKLILGKRERPHLVFDNQHNILALVTGVCASADDSLSNERRWAMCNNNPWPGYYDKTFTHIQKVRAAADSDHLMVSLETM